MFCPNCGTENENDAKVCQSCGQELQTENQQQVYGNQQQAYGNQQQAYGMKKAGSCSVCGETVFYT